MLSVAELIPAYGQPFQANIENIETAPLKKIKKKNTDNEMPGKIGFQLKIDH